MSKRRSSTSCLWFAVTLLTFILAAGSTQAQSGHEAGADWANDNGITDPSDCDGNSESFIEGCEEQAIENCIDECDDDECEEECEDQ
jgi:hypothetical protein